MRKVEALIVAAGLALTSSAGFGEAYDLVIYGGTPAGISAAVQAKRSGLKAVMIEPGGVIGGLTTGGLGRTDIGSKNGFGGIAREFYQAVATWYRDPQNWTRQTREEFASAMKTANDKRFVPDEDAMWCFEPSVARKILEGWEKRDGLKFVRRERLDRSPGGVTKKNGRITAIRMESGKIFKGRMFMDATYEGDLLAAAGVAYAVGREDNATYGETINGMQRRQGSHKLKPGIDPYVVKGDPSSGLLPGIEAPTDDPAPDGTGDRRVQAYCYRMCLTDDPANRIPFKKPAGYDEREYELLFRNIEQGDVKLHRNQGQMPNRKTDTNNDGGFSTDYIGQNWAYPEASYAEREKIAQRHLRYQQGLMWTLANHPRVPKDIREEYARWGTCRDEFVGERGDGWQNQLYVREARRMIGEYVMTEHNARKTRVAPRPVAYASYTMDSHHCRRYVGKDGFVHNEGDVQDAQLYPRPVERANELPFIGFGRYGVDYGSLVPKRDECENLLVPVCLSASHIAFGSIRMEPMFFSLGQSAAVAAALAIERGCAVQDVDYPTLRTRLEQAGQLVPPAPAEERESVTREIRGIGKVKVDYVKHANGDSVTRYSCPSDKTAAWLASKRRADMLSFGDVREAEGLLVLDGIGSWAFGVKGSVWYEMFCRAGRRPAVTRPQLPKAPYPAWMDGFDRYGTTVWLGGGGAGFDVPGDFEWLRRLDLGMCVAITGEDDAFAPGEVDWSPYDWYEAVARKYGLPYRMLTHVGRLPWSWERQTLPQVFPGDPRYFGLPAFYYPEVLTTGAMNAGVPGVASDAPRFDYRRRLTERLSAEDSHLMGFQVCEELTCGTVNYLATCARTPGVVAIWNEWMRKKGIASPGPVPVPEDFLPRDAANDLDLFGTWEISVDGEKSWTKGMCNDPMLMMYSGSWHEKPPARYRDVFLRRTFKVPAGRKAALRYLHIASAAYKTVYGAVPDVWVNGRACPALPGEFSRCFDLGDALKEGINEIKVNAHGACLPGYVYLTAKPLTLYPDMPEALNRRWALATDFASHLRVRYIEDRCRAHRAVDAIRPLKMMAVKEAQDEAIDLCRRYGAYFHDTGGAGAFWCPYTGARLSKAHGFPWSCEQGGPPKSVERLRAMVSFYLQYGNDAADLVFAVRHYRQDPQIRAWCEENIGLLKTIGALNLPQPDIAILRSSRCARLGYRRELERHDVGRGLLQASGREFVYLEIPDLRNAAFVDRYPVIIDCATVVMENDDAAAIRRYVEAGGIFIALPDTGRDLPERKNARPLALAFGLTPGGEKVLRRTFGKGTLVWLGDYSRLTMKDVNGAFVADGSSRETLNDLLDGLGVKAPLEVWGRRIWASHRESKNGLYDVLLTTRMENPGAGVEPLVSGRSGIVFRNRECGWFATPPAKQFLPMESTVTKMPRADICHAGVYWLNSFADQWYPLEAVPASAAPALDPDPDVLVLREGWSPTTPGLFGTLGWPEQTNVTFRTSVRVPDAWREDTVELVFNCGFVMRGLSPCGSVRVNGQGVPGRAPFKTFRQGGSFAFEVTELARANGGRLDIEVEIDGVPQPGAKALRERPNGVCGTFALVRHPKAARVIPLDGPWFACVDYGARVPVRPGDQAEHCFWETKFPTPAEKGARRIVLVSDEPIRGLMLNRHVLNFPDHVRRADVTDLLLGATEVNVLRWVPDDIHGIASHNGGMTRRYVSRLGKLRLEVR